MKLKKGDTVLIISGKDKGKKAKILNVFPKEKRIIAEGVNLRKKHVRPKKSGQKGQIVESASAIDISNTKFICPKCNKATRIGFKMTEKNKFRICKKCGLEV